MAQISNDFSVSNMLLFEASIFFLSFGRDKVTFKMNEFALEFPYSNEIIVTNISNWHKMKTLTETKSFRTWKRESRRVDSMKFRIIKA